MASLENLNIDPTLQEMNQLIEKNGNREKMYSHKLSASMLDFECSKKMWFYFRMCKNSHFNSKALKRFDSGYWAEDKMAKRLRTIKEIELHTIDKDTGKQFRVDFCGDHFTGRLDGAIVGILQAPKTWHVWEHKDSSKFNEVVKLKSKYDEKEVLYNWNKTYYMQAQIYMGFTGMTRHYMTITSPGCLDEISIRTDFNQKFFDNLRDKIELIINAKEPAFLTAASTNKDYYGCKICDFRGICHETELPIPNCRTCVHSTPETDLKKATWTCKKHDNSHIPIDFETQKKGCNQHLYIPYLLRSYGQAIRCDENDKYIVYQKQSFINITEDAFPEVIDGCIGIFTSKQLFELQESIFNMSESDTIKKEFNGEIVEEGKKNI